jgi:hypothetical protein
MGRSMKFEHAESLKSDENKNCKHPRVAKEFLHGKFTGYYRCVVCGEPFTSFAAWELSTQQNRKPREK